MKLDTIDIRLSYLYLVCSAVSSSVCSLEKEIRHYLFICLLHICQRWPLWLRWWVWSCTPFSHLGGLPSQCLLNHWGQTALTSMANIVAERKVETWNEVSVAKGVSLKCRYIKLLWVHWTAWNLSRLWYLSDDRISDLLNVDVLFITDVLFVTLSDSPTRHIPRLGGFSMIHFGAELSNIHPLSTRSIRQMGIRKRGLVGSRMVASLFWVSRSARQVIMTWYVLSSSRFWYNFPKYYAIASSVRCYYL